MSLSPERLRASPYIFAVAAIGTVVITDSLIRVLRNPPGFEWYVLATLTLLTGSLTVKLPSVPARLSVSETFVFTSVLLFGSAAGTLTVVLDSLVISFWMDRAKLRPSKVLFNMTAPALAIRTASEAFFAVSGAHAGAIGRQEMGPLILPVFAFSFIYFFINATLVAGVLSKETGASVASIWIRNFTSLSINYFVGSSIAMLIVAYTNKIDLTVIGIIIPLLLVSYVTFKVSLGRLEDATKHIAHVDEMYLSTIETLAMAVDAKDQITHGHIRRVQVYAVELAKRVGVSDDSQLKAIEVAALLHDMGKLAIPEHILNKPGKLTDAEFTIMKRHADIGAELLSQVKFPYPVVPIVRHHHENWNGSGYPSRIAGTDIPIGARILSVVDCFDALTSDRPYRPRLTNIEAFYILNERRGGMYDPLIVDTFIAVYEEIAPKAIRAGEEAHTIPRFDAEEDPVSHIDEIPRSTPVFAGVQQALKSAVSLDDTMGILLHRAKALIPVTDLVFFAKFEQTDSLIAAAVAGLRADVFRGLTIRKGERIVGWVAANRATIANSDATLDLGALAELSEPRLRLAIATPIIARSGDIAGVLSAYSPQSNHFSVEQQYAFEQLAAVSADSIATMIHPSSATIRPL